MSPSAALEIKGWCPGALRPMESGDGLIVRVRPWVSALTLEQAGGLADIAERLGNGHIDLTRRANLQIRGLREEFLAVLHRALGRLRLLDRDVQTEAARNIMVGPFAGPTVRTVAAALTEALAADHRLAAILPAKFAWLVDEAGPLCITGERAEVALCIVPEGVALRVDARWLGLVLPDAAVSTALAAARALLERREMPPLATLATAPRPGRRLLGSVRGMCGIAAPFGRLEAGQLRGLVALAAKAGASQIRLSPWRALYIDAPLDGVRDLGLIVEADDPLLRIEACPGRPACRSASVDTRGAARRLAAAGFVGSLHLSGCAKGCARSAPADLVLVGDRGRYGVIRNGTARDLPQRMIDARDPTAALHG